MPLIEVQRRDHIVVLTLNRPETMNALGLAGDGDEFACVCQEINRDSDLRCVVLTGAGRAFSAGGDLRAMRDREGAFAGSGVGIRDGYRHNLHLLVRALHGLELPVIAAVNGPAIGLGCDIACLADIRIASETAKFGITFLKLGIIPGDGGTWLTPRIIGMSRTARLLFTGDVIDAQKSLAWGLVDEVVPPERLMEAALELATAIAAQPPHALRLAKSLLRQGQSASFETMLELSASAQALSHLTDDHMEGVAALLERRAPQFQGR